MPYIDRKDGKVSALYANCQYEGQEYLPDDNEEVLNFGKPTAQEIINQQAKQFLDSTDWEVIRHRDQLELGIPTSLTDEEFKALLQKRQEMRDQIK